jgi:hypothetical protein
LIEEPAFTEGVEGPDGECGRSARSQVWRKRGERLVDVHNVVTAFADQSLDLGPLPQGKRYASYSAADGNRNRSTTGNDVVSLATIGFHRAWGQDIDLVASSRELIGEARDVGRYATRVGKIIRGNQSDLDLLIPPRFIGSLCIPGQRLGLI